MSVILQTSETEPSRKYNRLAEYEEIKKAVTDNPSLWVAVKPFGRYVNVDLELFRKGICTAFNNRAKRMQFNTRLDRNNNCVWLQLKNYEG